MRLLYDICYGCEDCGNTCGTGADAESFSKAHAGTGLRRNYYLATRMDLGVVADLGNRPVHIEDIGAALLGVGSEASCLVYVVADILAFDIAYGVRVHHSSVYLYRTVIDRYCYTVTLAKNDVLITAGMSKRLVEFYSYRIIVRHLELLQGSGICLLSGLHYGGAVVRV